MRVISRTSGKGGPEVPAIGLGCMVLSGSYGPVDEKESLATLHRARYLRHSWDSPPDHLEENWAHSRFT